MGNKEELHVSTSMNEGMGKNLCMSVNYDIFR